MRNKTIGDNTMCKTRIWLAFLFAALLLPATARIQAQEGPGKIHGHVQDPLGIAMKGGSVILSTDGGQTAKYTFTTDDNGDYKGDGVAPGTYTAVYRNADTPAGKFVDEFQNVKITSGTDLLLNFDMSRPEYIEKMSPEQKKQYEELKTKNAAVVKSNLVVKTMNADLMEARQDNAKGKNGNCLDAQNHAIYGKSDAACTAAGGKVNNPAEDYQKSADLMTKDLTGLPKDLESGEPLLLVELGVAQKGLKKYDDAVTNLKKAIDLETAAKTPRNDVLVSAYDALGETLVQQNKIPEAQAAYDSAAQAAVKVPPANPKSAAQYYTNEAIMMDRAGNIDATVAAADKAIAADPDKPIPYYLKGKALINKATVDPKTQKIVAPPGCAEAYQKYLELAPDGPFANDAKSVLAEMGTTVSSSYKASKKK